MTRRKKAPRRKIQKITDASGWTHVVKGPPGTIDPKTARIPLEHETPPDSRYTLDTYLDRFRTHYAPAWRASDCCRNLSRAIEQDVLPAPHVTITRCVCLGLGSMTAGPETPSYELAALISMLDLLGKTHTISPPIFQDPLFTPLDRAILHALGYTVVPHPAAFAALTRTTFLFAPHLECAHHATALDAATPALSVGSDLQVYVDGLLSSLAEKAKEGSCRVFRKFLGETESRPMPDFDRTSWCESTRIYWVKSTEDGSGESTIEQGVRSMQIAER